MKCGKEDCQEHNDCIDYDEVYCIHDSEPMNEHCRKCLIGACQFDNGKE